MPKKISCNQPQRPERDVCEGDMNAVSLPEGFQFQLSGCPRQSFISLPDDQAAGGEAKRSVPHERLVSTFIHQLFGSWIR